MTCRVSFKTLTTAAPLSPQLREVDRGLMEEDTDSELLVRPVPVSSRDEVPIVPVLAAVKTLLKLCKVSWLHAFIPKPSPTDFINEIADRNR